MNLVLCYHHVAPNRTIHNTTPELFGRHVEVLRDAGYAFLDHDEFASLARRGFPGAAKTALITFDDGHADNWFHARPLLQSLEVPAVLFAITNPLAVVEGNARGPAEEPVLDGGVLGEDAHTPMRWSELKAWQATGMLSVQSHTHSHGQFSRFKGTTAELRQLIIKDLEKVQEAFRSHLGTEPTSLAWPWGYSNPVMRSAAAALGFGLQFSTVPGYNGPWAVSQRLHRICLDGAATDTVEAWALRSGAKRAAKLYSLARAGVTAARGHLKSMQLRSFGTAR